MDERGVNEGRAFYDALFKSGYHADWDSDQTEWVAEIVRDSVREHSGTCLDFGCGSGPMSGLLKSLLPGWRIVGTDISDVAVGVAKRRHPDCDFLELQQWRKSDEKYDLIFSHHVLEHVPNIEETLDELGGRARQGGRMLHFFPYHSDGTLEEWLCSKVRGGRDPEKCGRYFFEDPGHLRRFDEQCLEKTLKALSYRVDVKERWFSGHFWGSINWMTKSPPWVLAKIVNPARAKSLSAGLALAGAGALIGALNLLRLPAHSKDRLVARWEHGFRPKHLLLALPLPFALVSRPIDELISRCARAEEKRRRREPGGQLGILLEMPKGIVP